jgi:hypothetical protein
MEYPDSDVLVQNYYQYQNNVQLYLHSISAMGANALKVFSGSAQPFQVFVSIDRTSAVSGSAAKVLVPYQTAVVLSGAFIHGLVTRLLLDKYKTTWAALNPPIALWNPLPLVAAPPKGGGPAPNPLPVPMNANDWAQKYLSTLSTNLQNPASWNALSAAHGSTDYFGCLSYATDSSLQTVGISMGWLAGDALTDGTYPNAQACQAAIFTLLKGKYKANDFGWMVGYTFSYLSGFLSSERTKAMIAGTTAPSQEADPSKAPLNIYNALLNAAAGATSGVTQANVSSIADTFFKFVLSEFYAVSGGSPAEAAKIQGFLLGFEQGLTAGAEVMYRQLFEEGYALGYAKGYELGYTTGFKNGYTQGYSAGWTSGYAVGYQNGQNTWMSGLQNIIGGLGGMLNDPGTMTTILGDISVGRTIIGLF